MFRGYNIKKLVLYLIIIIVTSFSVGFVILATSNGGNLSRIANTGKSIDEIKEESAEFITEINVTSTSADIIIVPENRNNIKAHLTGNSTLDQIGIESNVSGSKLDIKVENKITFGINIPINRLELYVYIPNSYSKDLKVKSTSGSIEIGKLQLKELSSRSTSGDTKLNNITAGVLSYSSTSGSLEGSDLDTKQSTLKSTSGGIRISKFSGDLKAEQTSGNIYVAYREFNNNVELHAVSGDIKLSIPESSEFAINARSTSGSISSGFPVTIEGEQNKNKLIGYVKGKNNKINISTTSGSIKIDK